MSKQRVQFKEKKKKTLIQNMSEHKIPQGILLYGNYY